MASGNALSVKRSTVSAGFSALRQLCAVAAIVLGAIGTGGLPHTVRQALVLIGGAVLTAEHAVSKKTGTTAPAPTATTATAPARLN